MHRLLATFLFLLTASIAQADSTSSIRIAHFSGDRAAAISYTFDDNLRDQYTVAIPMLKEVGIKATFFVIGGATTNTPTEGEAKKDLKRAWGSISWPELKKMAAQGHEIGSHTWSHPNLTGTALTPADIESQFTKNNDAIQQHLGITPITLAYPFNAHNAAIDAIADKYYVGYRTFQAATSGKSTVDNLNKWADDCIRDKKWGVMMTHAVASGYAALTDSNIFLTHLKYVKAHEDQIWIDTFANVARYNKERDAAKLTTDGNLSANSLSCTLAAPLDPAKYDVPLTLVIDAKSAVAAQAIRAGKDLPVTLKGGVIQIQAVPAPEPISVTWH